MKYVQLLAGFALGFSVVWFAFKDSSVNYSTNTTIHKNYYQTDRYY